MSIEYPYILNDFLNTYDKPVSLSREHIIEYIDNNAGKLTRSDRVRLLLAITNSIGDAKIDEKGTGTAVKYKDISLQMLQCIHNFVFERLSASREAFIKTLN